MKSKSDNTDGTIYKSPILRFIVFLFFVFIPFQIFLIYFIQQISVRLHIQKQITAPKKPTQTPQKKKIQSPRAAAVKKKSQDDLQLISGIGPKTREAMNNHGITTYTQIADLKLDQLNQLLEEAGIRIKATQSWIDQAKQLK
ncbi:MAG: hypothetical protein JEZ00_02960 [Anaerolineaceae bacterium]|nr:hypothetical protein [Anaerolineaceae bacterium]